MTNNFRNQKLEDLHDFFKYLSLLAERPRKGFMKFYTNCAENMYHQESVAAHMWKLSILSGFCVAFSVDGQKLDFAKCIRMAVIHDIAEAIIGDITPHEFKQCKGNEMEAFEYLLSLIPDKYEETKNMFQDAMLEYKAQKTPEAQFVKYIDKWDFGSEILIEFGKVKRQSESIEDFKKFLESTNWL